MVVLKNGFFRNTFKIIKYNLGTFIKFEIFYKLILAIIFIPLSIGIFGLAMKLTGYSYLTIENISSFLLNPITIFILFLLIIFLTVITIFDISTLIVIFDLSYHEKKIGVKDAIKVSLGRCKNIFNIKNISVAFLVLFLIPFLNLGMSSNVITSIKIPEFIMDFIVSNNTLFVLYLLLYLFLVFIITRWFYSLLYMVIENKSFKESRKASSTLVKGNKILNIIKILFMQLFIALIFIIVLLLGFLIIIILNKILSHFIIVKSLLITIIWLFLVFALIFVSIASNGLSYAVLSSLFYKHKIDKNEKIIPIEYKQVNKVKKKNTALKCTLILISILLVVGGNFLTYRIVSGKTDLKKI